MARKKTEEKEEIQEDVELKLTDLPGVGPAAEAKLVEAGFESVLSIAVASPANLVDAAGFSESTARKVIKAARDSLNMGFVSALDAEEDREKNSTIVSTGSKAFDGILDGGIKSGGITIMYAPGTVGKSQVAHQIAINAIVDKTDSIVVYIDTEGTCNVKRFRQMLNRYKISNTDANDYLKRIRIVNVHTADHQIFMAEQIESLFNKGQKVSLVVVDSLTALFRSGFSGRGELAPRQQKLNKHLRTLQKIAQLHDIPVFVTNQVMDNPGQMYGNPTKPVGGHIVTHAGMEIISLTKNSKGLRTAKLLDSMYLPESEATFIITENGIEDE